MASFFSDNEDLRYYFEKGIPWEEIVEVTELLYRQPGAFKDARDAVGAYKDVLDLVGEIAAERVAPHAKEIDRQGVGFKDGEAFFHPRMQSIFDELRSIEIHGLCLPRELGGQNCPLTVFFLMSELLARADISVMAHNSFHGPIAMAMLVYSLAEGTTEIDPALGKITQTRFAKQMEEIRTGSAWGSMDITEPDAGSDMAALRTVAEQDAAGNWLVSGEKIFITSGHGKYHFVIARTIGSAKKDGLGGLSMFLVEAYEDRADGSRVRKVSLDRIEEKIGHHGSATAALTFDRAPALLVGKVGEGFKYMLTLMNNARIGVGFESIGISEAAYRLARAYAAERRSMGKTIDRHEMIADYLDEMETDILGVRAMAVSSAIHQEIAFKTNLLIDQGFFTDAEEIERRKRLAKRHKHHARRLTPLLKYLAAEKAVEIARRCVQIHGGVGYTKEFLAEKLLRDALVLPIYEGTSQIQSLMAMKDTLTSAMTRPSRFARRVATARLRAASARDPLERRVARLQSLSLSAQQHLLTQTARDKYRSIKSKPLSEWRDFLKSWDPKRDFTYAMLHAERLTRLLADEAIAEILLDQSRQHAERREILERHLERAEPRARYLHEQITTPQPGVLSRIAHAEADGASRKTA
jgi:alkylation response protein AidB-like acyl-CoA dehydrogenase